jgi:hypothetical protein
LTSALATLPFSAAFFEARIRSLATLATVGSATSSSFSDALFTACASSKLGTLAGSMALKSVRSAM